MENKVTTLEGKEITQQSVSGAGITVTLDGTVGVPTLTGNVTTATYTPAVGETAASWTNQGNLVTGSTVETFVGAETAKALKEAKAYSDSLHTTSLDYVVLGDNENLPTASAQTLGKIYLVKEGNAANGESNIDAISGSYVEYMTRKIGDGESATYAWEKIGTTASDLTGYVKSIATANGVSGVVSGNEATITVQDGTTAQKGIVQLASTHEASDTTKAATGATVAAAISGIASTSQSDNGVKVTTAGGSVTGVEVTTTSIVSGGALVQSVTGDNLITAADALAAIKLAKPENYVASVTGYKTDGTQVTSTQGAAIKVLDSRGTTVTANDLWGTSVTTDG